MRSLACLVCLKPPKLTASTAAKRRADSFGSTPGPAPASPGQPDLFANLPSASSTPAAGGAGDLFSSLPGPTAGGGDLFSAPAPASAPLPDPFGPAGSTYGAAGAPGGE